MYWEASEANLQAADDASRKALLLDPELAEAHVSRGLAISLSKRYDEAEIEFRTALRLDPKQFEAHYFYARACVQQGKLEDASRLFEKAAEVKPDDYQAPQLLGMVYSGLGRKADAEGPDLEARARALGDRGGSVPLHLRGSQRGRPRPLLRHRGAEFPRPLAARLRSAGAHA